MSFYVELLLHNAHEIRTLSIESDEYNDLLLIMRTLNELQGKNLDESDLYLVNAVIDFGSYRAAGQAINKSRTFVAKRFKEICAIIANKVGDYFLNSNYLDYLKIKYCLTDSESEILYKALGEKIKNK